MRRMHVVLVTSLAVLTVVSLHGQTVTPRVERVESDMVKLVAPLMMAAGTDAEALLQHLHVTPPEL